MTRLVLPGSFHCHFCRAECGGAQRHIFFAFHLDFGPLQLSGGSCPVVLSADAIVVCRVGQATTSDRRKMGAVRMTRPEGGLDTLPCSRQKDQPNNGRFDYTCIVCRPFSTTGNATRQNAEAERQEREREGSEGAPSTRRVAYSSPTRLYIFTKRKENGCGKVLNGNLVKGATMGEGIPCAAEPRLIRTSSRKRETPGRFLLVSRMVLF